MFTINARRLASVLSEFRRVLGVNRLLGTQLVTFIVAANTLTIRAKSKDTGIAYEASCKGQNCEFTAKLIDFNGIGRSGGAVTLNAAGGKFSAEWRETNRTITRTFDQYSKPDFPAGPIVLYSNRRELASTILEAAKLTDPESTRYALGCIRLRGSDGQVAGTDGRQAFVHSGFSLPPGELLVLANAIKKFDALSKANAISVGLRDDWIGLRVGTINARWSLDIKRQTTGCYPDLDRCIPRLVDSRSRLVINDSDATFLIEQLKRLSPDRFEQGPITIDTAGVPTVRMRLRTSEFQRLFSQGSARKSNAGADEDDSPQRVCELQLDASNSSGAGIRCALDHLHLLAMLQMGFRQIEFQSDRAPVFSYDATRAYVCSVSSTSFVTGAVACDLNLSRSDTMRVA